MEGIISLERLEGMSLDERWALIDGNVKPVRPPPTLRKCKPNWIGPLYRNIPMPHYTAGGDGTSIALGSDNVFNGTLVDKDEHDDVVMTWKGYTCQLYDGELKMAPRRSEKESTITGRCNGIAFAFAGTELMFGCWPGFLLLYH